MAFTWQAGRQMYSTTATSGTVYRYRYNNDGIRYMKWGGGVTTNYYLDGSTILAETKSNGTEIIYMHDENGNYVGFNYKDEDYYYAFNAQGDVVGIYNVIGEVVARYRYDAWGKVISVTDGSLGAITSSTHVANVNPIRYRGYYYDVETGLYYLNSRYYDPTVGRFVNADNQLSTDDINGMNLYAYCGSEPVNRIDPTGHAWYHWLAGAAVVAAFAVATVVTAGGFAAGVAAVAAVGSGVAAATTASTVAAAGLIASATCFGAAVYSAASSSKTVSEFNAQGNWSMVGGTLAAGAVGSAMACGVARESSSKSATKSSPISASDARRIQNAANRTHQKIVVVGSRASGTAGPNSDWDYIMYGNSAQRHSAASSVPHGIWGGENNTGIDVFSAYQNGPNPVVLDRSKPYIEFFPE